MRVGLVLGVVGYLLRLFALAFIAPVIVALIYGEGRESTYFAIGGLMSYLGGRAMSWGMQAPRVFRRSEAFGVVAGTWLIVALFASVPYVLDGLRPVDAFVSRDTATDDALSLLDTMDAPVHDVAPRELAEIAGTRTPQGVPSSSFTQSARLRGILP